MRVNRILLNRIASNRSFSSTSTGRYSIDQLKSEVESQNVETVMVGITDMYSRFMGKRFDAKFFVDDALDNGTHACNYLLACDMNMDPIDGFKFANWEQGFGDLHLVPDKSTVAKAGWLDEPTAVILCDCYDNVTHKLVEIAPRTMLRRQLEQAESMGYSAKAATELEFYTYDTTFQKASQEKYSKKVLRPVSEHIEDYHLLQTSREEGFMSRARRALRETGIPVENSKGEAGKGQHELNIRYSDPLNMADRHVLYKQILKELADREDKCVTFMPKPFEDTTGSGCHIHLSLWSNDGSKNVFFNGSGDTWENLPCTDEFRWFLGGWIKYTPDFMPFLAPTINSYKRYQSNSWAPTRLAWSYDNRTAGFRVVGSGKNSLRIENRIGGADVNPYLAFSAALAAGLEGIRQKIEPPACFRGNIYEASEISQVPKTLREAVDLFVNSPVTRSTLGDDVVDHYARFYRAEQEAFDKFVTDWERSRYFEMI